jgi:hypothetical protein
MSANDPLVVYLDLNHWYALGAALAGRPARPEHAVVWQKLKDQVDQGQLVFPLSAIHYMELTENPRDELRREAADAMRGLSRFATIAPLDKIVDEELARELNRRFGRPAFPMKVPKFGVGVGFAFSQDIRLRPFENIPGEQLPLIEARLGISTDRFEAAVNDALEYSMLTSPSAERGQIPGLDPYAARRVADKELESFKVMLHTLRTDPDISKRPLDAICVRQYYYDIPDNYERALASAGYTQSSVPLRSGEDFTSFLMNLPSRHVVSMIQLHYLRDVERDWTINDLRDIHALSTAIPYCDVVVTDKKAWDVTANRAKLGEKFNTAIFCRLADLATHLGL